MSADTRPTFRVEAGSDGVQIWIDDAKPLTLSWKWLRDHSEDDASFDPITRQRTVDTFSIDRHPPAGVVTVGDDHLAIAWPDATRQSILSLRTLVGLRASSPPRTIWRTPAEQSVEPVDYTSIVETDHGLSAFLSDISQFGFGRIGDAPAGQDAAQVLAERIGYVRRTIFGDMWTLSSQVSAHADSAYGAETLEPHTDGSYSHDGPGTQLFICEERTGEGGESVLVDGFAAAHELKTEDPAAFELLTSVSVPSHYVEDGVELRASRPTIRLDAAGEIAQVTFNNYDRSPFILPPQVMAEWYDAYAAFHTLITDRDSWWVERLDPGDGVLFDNWRCLHGRMAFTGIRVFHGCYLNHEDLESRIRLSDC